MENNNTLKENESFEITEEKNQLQKEGYILYGLKCNLENEIFEIKDITTEKEQIEFIAKNFNEHQPEKAHIFDILENYLIDFKDF